MNLYQGRTRTADHWPISAMKVPDGFRKNARKNPQAAQDCQLVGCISVVNTGTSNTTKTRKVRVFVISPLHLPLTPPPPSFPPALPAADKSSVNVCYEPALYCLTRSTLPTEKCNFVGGENGTCRRVRIAGPAADPLLVDGRKSPKCGNVVCSSPTGLIRSTARHTSSTSHFRLLSPTRRFNLCVCECVSLGRLQRCSSRWLPPSCDV